MLDALKGQFRLYCDRREYLEQNRKIAPKLRDIVLRLIEGRAGEPEAMMGRYNSGVAWSRPVPDRQL